MNEERQGILTVITGDRSSGKTHTLWFQFFIPYVNVGVRSALISHEFGHYTQKQIKPHILPEHGSDCLWYRGANNYDGILSCIGSAICDAGVQNFAIDEEVLAHAGKAASRTEYEKFFKDLVKLAIEYGVRVTLVEHPIRLEHNDTRPLLPSCVSNFAHNILFCSYSDGKFKQEYIKNRSVGNNM